MTSEEMRREEFNKLIKQPLNEAWSIIKIPLDNNTDEGWNEYVDAFLKFYDKLSTAKTPHQLAFLNALSKLIDEAAEVIGSLD